MKTRLPKLATLALLFLLPPGTPDPVAGNPAGPSGETAPSAAGAAALPDSPAGRAVAAWFEALNSKSEPNLRRVIADYFTGDVPRDQRLVNWRGIWEESGTLTPVRVLTDSPRELVVLAREAAGTLAEVGFRLAGEPPRIVGIRLEPARQEEAADPDGSPLTEAQAVAGLTRLADSLAREERFSGVVRLERNGRVALERAWGEADRERHVANRADTKFNLGSINKSFTRALIAKLIEQGKLSPGDRLSKHLPDFPRDKADRITIQQLLDMRSGLGDFFNPRYDRIDKSKLRNQRDWFPLFVDDPLLYEPGEGEEYSNAGYCVLGAVAEAVTGRNYYDLVREWIYAPAGMTSTDSYGLGENVPNRAFGYTRRAGGGAGGLKSNRSEQPWRGSAAGGGYSTAADLSRYVRALREGKILEPATAERFFGARRGPDGKLQLRMGIAGGSPGVNGVILTPGEWTLIVLANFDPPIAETIGRRGRSLVERVDGAGGSGAGIERVRK